MVEPLTKRSLMLFGKYQGYELGNVPPNYLLWIYNNLTLSDDLRTYIENNKSTLEAEVRRAAKEKRR